MRCTCPDPHCVHHGVFPYLPAELLDLQHDHAHTALPSEQRRRANSGLDQEQIARLMLARWTWRAVERRDAARRWNRALRRLRETGSVALHVPGEGGPFTASVLEHNLRAEVARYLTCMDQRRAWLRQHAYQQCGDVVARHVGTAGTLATPANSDRNTNAA